MTDVLVGFRPPCWSPSRWAPAWRLHTNLYKFGENISPKTCCVPNLGEGLCIFTFFQFWRQVLTFSEKKFVKSWVAGGHFVIWLTPWQMIIGKSLKWLSKTQRRRGRTQRTPNQANRRDDKVIPTRINLWWSEEHRSIVLSNFPLNRNMPCSQALFSAYSGLRKRLLWNLFCTDRLLIAITNHKANVEFVFLGSKVGRMWWFSM